MLMNLLPDIILGRPGLGKLDTRVISSIWLGFHRPVSTENAALAPGTDGSELYCIAPGPATQNTSQENNRPRQHLLARQKAKVVADVFSAPYTALGTFFGANTLNIRIREPLNLLSNGVRPMLKHTLLIAIFVLLASYNSQTPLQAAESPKDVLSRSVGSWTYTYKMTVPTEMTFTGDETTKWVLGKQFLESNTTLSNGDTQLGLANYSKEANTFFFWSFKSDGSFPLGATTGTWDEDSETMTLKGEYLGGFSLTGSYRYSDAAQVEFEMELMAPNGNVVFAMSASGTRKK